MKKKNYETGVPVEIKEMCFIHKDNDRIFIDEKYNHNITNPSKRLYIEHVDFINEFISSCSNVTVLGEVVKSTAVIIDPYTSSLVVNSENHTEIVNTISESFLKEIGKDGDEFLLTAINEGTGALFVLFDGETQLEKVKEYVSDCLSRARAEVGFDDYSCAALIVTGDHKILEHFPTGTDWDLDENKVGSIFIERKFYL